MKTLLADRGMFAALGLLTITLTSCGRPPQETRKVATDAATTVTAQAVRVGDVARTVTVTGSLAALQDTALSAKQGGRLAEVSVREGDSVAAGQIVARVDDVDLRRQVQSAEASVASSVARLRQARAASAQQVSTVEASIGSARAAYEQQVATSQASVQSAESALKSAHAGLSEVKEGARSEERLQTESALHVAEANFKKATSDVTRYQRLHGAGAISDAELEQYTNTRDVAQANLRSAQAAVQMQANGSRRQDIEQAQERVQQADQALRQAKAARAQDLVRKADLDNAIANRAQIRVKQEDVRAAQEALSQAQSALAIAKQAVADAVVRAPHGGVVSERSAEPGQVVMSGAVLLHIVSLDSVFFEPSVPDTDLHLIRTGQPLRVTVDGYPGRPFTGAVTRIYPTASESSRAIPLRVTIPNAQGLLRPKMFATGHIQAEIHRQVVMVPREAVVHTDDGTDSGDHVFTLEGSQVRERKVATGLANEDGSWIEVKGIDPRAKVITKGLSGLSDGAQVAESAANPSASR